LKTSELGLKAGLKVYYHNLIASMTLCVTASCEFDYKSRKNLVEKEIVKCDLLKAAGYVRLSVNKTDEPSQSIENPKKIIEAYAESNPDLLLERFYIDDQVSGRDFNRPVFNEMLEDIQAGKINCVIVKDLSRLGREMIDVGYYIQMFFPSKGVRFISIGNQIDTLDGIWR